MIRRIRSSSSSHSTALIPSRSAQRPVRHVAVWMGGVAVVLSACSGGETTVTESSPSVQVVATTLTTEPAPTTTTGHQGTTVPQATVPAFDVAENQAAVNAYIDAVAFHLDCSSIDCLFADAITNRMKNLHLLANDIIDPVYAGMVAAERAAFKAWGDCATYAPTPIETCGSELSAYEAAVVELYDAVR